MAKQYGFNEVADSILAVAGKTKDEIEDFPEEGVALVPQKPLQYTLDESWPLMTISRGLFEGAAPPAMKSAPPQQTGDKGNTDSTWADAELDLDLDEPKTLDTAMANMGISSDQKGEPGWGDIDDELGLTDVDEPSDNFVDSSANPILTGNAFVVPSSGVSTIDQWIRNSPLPVDHIAAGSFEGAMQVFLNLYCSPILLVVKSTSWCC